MQPESKELEKIEKLTWELDHDERMHLKVREMCFARLIAEEEWSQRDAYIYAYKPSPEALPASIDQIACRIAARPRVKAEIERIRVRIREEEMAKDKHLAKALDGNYVRDWLQLQWFAIAAGDYPMGARMAAMRELGKLKAVDAYVGAGQIIDSTAKSGSPKTAGEMRARLVKYALDSLTSNQKEITIKPDDIQPGAPD